ncbi:Uncharacterized conserved protein [Legionella beliardensis]|uniref:Uncharacterized conserved protein n=1 Tax=Legionella beliardensis TaxID=91822 RepID=A0A378I434_9GAMM|nr:hypothetical protein [Legionella beliardensis]STX29938.1 Uncharacterized conserved protein [Legionella beliardensis]
MAKLPTLSNVLAYNNTAVIQRFKQNHPKDSTRAELLFTDMLRYLWLCEKHWWDCKNNPNEPKLNFIPVMHEEMRAIDNMWHEFILLTRDYHDFCHSFFGRFLHHEPNMRSTLAYSPSEFTNSLNLFLNYIYDNLGEDILIAWFKEHLEEVA